jgi:hypothetical protein
MAETPLLLPDKIWIDEHQDAVVAIFAPETRQEVRVVISPEAAVALGQALIKSGGTVLHRLCGPPAPDSAKSSSVRVVRPRGKQLDS